MKKHLYDIFADKWYHGGTIYFYSDPHFSDLDSYKFRFPEKFNLVEEDYISVCSNPKKYIDWQYERYVEELDQMQIDNINKVCNKNDTLIILGDVGNIQCVKKLKAGYKVLILGNHDKGASNYKRIDMIEYFHNNSLYSYYDKKGNIVEGYYPTTEEEAIEKYKEKYPNNFNIKCIEYNSGYNCHEDWTIKGDNGLFDEVYEGTLQISPKIILSHEPVDYLYCLNIHGHNHNVNPFGAYTEGIDCTSHYNCCAEQINYTPVSIKTFIEYGVLKNIADIHRVTIDKASNK